MRELRVATMPKLDKPDGKFCGEIWRMHIIHVVN